jgi:hypothetical protein
VNGARERRRRVLAQGVCHRARNPDWGEVKWSPGVLEPRGVWLHVQGHLQKYWVSSQRTVKGHSPMPHVYLQPKSCVVKSPRHSGCGLGKCSAVSPWPGTLPAGK